jgi:hypothetical protein
MPDDSLNLNFFGNNLYYKKIKTDTSNQWSNLYDLYNLIIDLSFADSGSDVSEADHCDVNGTADSVSGLLRDRHG